MHLRYLSLSLAAMLAAASPAWAVVIVNETFDNYTSEAEFHANWRGNPGSGAIGGTIEQVEEKFLLQDAIVHNADFNGDGNIDARDYVVWRNNRNAPGATQQMGDANGDGAVNGHDYRLWKESYATAPPTGPPGKAIKHIANTSPTPDTPDGNLVWQQPLDPNFFDGSIFPTEAEPIVLRGDIYIASGATQRNTIGLRFQDSNGASNLVELGFYNTNMHGAALRIQSWQTTPGPNPDWQFFDFDPSLDIDDRLPFTGGGPGNVTWSEIFERFGPAWHQFEMTITETSVLATIDLLRDGINNATGEVGVDSTLSFTGITLTQAGFNSLRIGGPSQLATTVDAWFDNIYLSGPQEPAGAALVTAPVPEPTTWALGLIAGVACLAARRCRRV